MLALYLEENARRQYLALQLGQPQVLSPEQVEPISRNLWRPNLLQKVWDYHEGKLRA